jgi:hypothetical protein
MGKCILITFLGCQPKSQRNMAAGLVSICINAY